jgi:hypothetical protein
MRNYRLRDSILDPYFNFPFENYRIHLSSKIQSSSPQIWEIWEKFGEILVFDGILSKFQSNKGKL